MDREKVRLQKYLSEYGVASRRAAERMIAEGRVMVNGSVVDAMGVKVDPAQDQIFVDGKRIETRPQLRLSLIHIYWIMIGNSALPMPAALVACGSNGLMKKMILPVSAVWG